MCNIFKYIFHASSFLTEVTLLFEIRMELKNGVQKQVDT